MERRPGVHDELPESGALLEDWMFSSPVPGGTCGRQGIPALPDRMGQQVRVRGPGPLGRQPVHVRAGNSVQGVGREDMVRSFHGPPEPCGTEVPAGLREGTGELDGHAVV